MARGAREASPALAAQWTTPDGGVTWQFTLRPDAVFASGAPVTAPDAEASLERVASRLGAGVVADIRSVDAATLEIVLTRPMAGLPEALAAPVFGILAVGAADLAAAGSGPFRLAGVQGDVVSLVRGGSDAYLDGIELHQFDDLGAAYDAFEAGSSTGASCRRRGPRRRRRRTAPTGSRRSSPSCCCRSTCSDPVFADVRFRRAIVTAIDRRRGRRAPCTSASPIRWARSCPTGVAGSDPGTVRRGLRLRPRGGAVAPGRGVRLCRAARARGRARPRGRRRRDRARPGRRRRSSRPSASPPCCAPTPPTSTPASCPVAAAASCT